MGFVKEFKEFAMKGNVMDMSVGVIIGGAFGNIVSSLVGDVLMPIVSLCTGGVDFTNLFVKLSGEGSYATLAEAQEAGQSVIAYGQFIQNIVDFICVEFCVFLMIKAMNQMNKKKEEEAPAPEPPAPSAEETLLTEIRDLLKKK